MAGRVVTAICHCGWYGSTLACAACPACGAGYQMRIGPERLRAICSIDATGHGGGVPKTMLVALVACGVIKAGAPTKPCPSPRSPRQRPPARAYQLTEAGRRVLEAAIVVEQTRADVAASVARHADLSPGDAFMARTADMERITGDEARAVVGGQGSHRASGLVPTSTGRVPRRVT